MTLPAEEKFCVVLAGLRGAECIASVCCQEGIPERLYDSWSKQFPEAGKRRLAADTTRLAAAPEVKDLWSDTAALKEWACPDFVPVSFRRYSQ